jgi:hypothetical protein
LQSTTKEPFTLSDSSVLSVQVGGVVSEHVFSASDFRNISNATAYEVASSINANPSLEFEARTAGAGKYVVLTAKSESNEDLQVVNPVGPDANLAFLFPVSKVETLRLYRNDRLQSKDGQVAMLRSNPIAAWSELSSPETIDIEVDGTGVKTYTITDQDFIDYTGYSTVAKNTLAAWASVLNKKVPGATFESAAGVLVVTSNVGATSRASISITGGSLVLKQMFLPGTSNGKDRDYTLNRNTGQIELKEALSASERLSVGSSNTRAFTESASFRSTTLLQDASLWFTFDNDSTLVSTGLNASVQIDVSVIASPPWGNRVRFTTAGVSFANVQAGDSIIIYDSALNSTSHGVYLVVAVDPAGSWFEIECPNMRAGRSHCSTTLLADGKVLIAGGFVGSNSTVTSLCELYDPTTNMWTPVASMDSARRGHKACLLSTGQVLVAGGVDSSGEPTDSCELYDPVNDVWLVTEKLPGAWSNFFLLPLSDDRVLASGIATSAGVPTNETWLYDVINETWVAGPALPGTPRTEVAACLNSDGLKVAVLGGIAAGGTVVDETAVFSAAATAWVVGSALPNPRYGAQAALLTNGTVLAVGGWDDLGVQLDTGVVFNFVSTDSVSTPAAPFVGDTLVTLGDGKGYWFQGASADMSAYNSATDTWSTVGLSLASSSRTRVGVGAVRLSDTEFIMLGGLDFYHVNWGLSEVYSSVSGWSVVDGNWTQSAVNLLENGISFARCQAIQKVVLPAGLYTASNVATALEGRLEGSKAITYQTNRFRVRTNTFSDGGSIAVVGVQNGDAFDISPSDAITNTGSHLPNVESGLDYGTPSFENMVVGGTSLSALAPITASTLPHSACVVGCPTGDWTDPDLGLIARGSNSRWNRTFISGTSEGLLETRDSFTWSPGDQFYLGQLYGFGPEDDLTVVADGDATNKRYRVPMYRKLKPTGSYGGAVTFVDADNSNAELEQAFGTAFDFNDFAIMMKARAITTPEDVNKSLLWRYERIGDGERAKIRYVYPPAANQSVSVAVDNLTDLETRISVQLPSGSPKIGATLRNSTRVGVRMIDEGNNGWTYVYLLGLQLSDATREIKLPYEGRDVLAFSGLVTGAISGATGTVVSDSLAPGQTGAGVLTLSGVVGTFIPGEAIAGDVQGAGTTTSSQYGYVTLTVDVSSGLFSDHQLPNGAQLYFDSTDPTKFSSGVIVSQDVTPTTIAYVDAGTFEGQLLFAGTLTYDTLPSTLQTVNPAVTVGDLFRFSSTSSLPTSMTDITMRALAVEAQLLAGHREGLQPPVVYADVTWFLLGDIASLSIFPIDPIAAKASNIASAVNALSCPVTAKVLTTPVPPAKGGDGVISLSHLDAYFSLAVDERYTNFYDAINWVQSTNYDPIAGYQFTLKKPVAAALATAQGCDWVNEDVRLVPLTAVGCANWANTPAITGLSSSCEIVESSQAHRLQISSLTPGRNGSVQIQGGSANRVWANVIGPSAAVTGGCLVTVPKAQAVGLQAGNWVKIVNTNAMPKAVFDSTTIAVSISASGLIQTSTPVWAHRISPVIGEVWHVQKQGDFTCYTYNGVRPDLSAVQEGDWVRIFAASAPNPGQPQLQTVNYGSFRVVRRQVTDLLASFWIQNANAAEDFGQCDCHFFTADSIMPGDKLTISTNLWGASNMGTWTVTGVGRITDGGPEYSDEFTFSVDTSSKAMTPRTNSAALGSHADLVKIISQAAATLFKRISSITSSVEDERYVDVKFDTQECSSLIGESAGSYLVAQDKLDFPTGLIVGIDGYSYSTGLIGEANRVLYGDTSNTATHPGVVAASTDVRISGPMVKRVQISLSLRVRSGVSLKDVADRTRSAVAEAVNKTGVGASIPVSSIITAATKVSGVVAVAVTYPNYSATNDLIPVQASEKPMILSPEQDVVVTFVGGE